MRVLVGTAVAAALTIAQLAPRASAEEQPQILPPVTERYAGDEVSEEPSFQRHVSPLFGRLGCNGRSCHGSFQGRGDFRLSLFGYDFKADHDELLKGEPPRANKDQPLESLILAKPTDADMHEGGKRYEQGGWEYQIFRRWLEAGAKFDEKDVQKLVRLEVTPAEILFHKPGETSQLVAVAVWPDGTREDVTCLCRFTSNSDQVARITADGLVTATDPGDTHVVIAYDNAVVPVPVIRPVSQLTGDAYPDTPTPTKIDELVVQKLKKLGVVQSGLCTDAEFLRRVSLDLTGTLPTAADVEAFLADHSPDKRAKKVEQLLETPAYAAWWATRLCDWTGNNDQRLNNVSAMPGGRGVSQQWYDWIYKRVEANVSYDKLVEGIVLATSREPDESYTEFCEEMTQLAKDDSEGSFADRPTLPYFWARNNFRTTEERAIGFAYTFLGIRIQCAQCHKHPFDQWSKADFDAFEGFFSTVQLVQQGARDKEVQEEYKKIVADLGLADSELRGNQLRRKFYDALRDGKTVPFPEIVSNPPRRPNNRRNRKQDSPSVTARVLGGEETDLAQLKEVREPLMDWLRQPDNPYFARAFVNRVWANYFNVGIVNPPDDLSLANPPSNRPLLDYLAAGFVAHGYNMKWVHREIVNSRTYQLSWRPNETNAKDERNFARAVPRRLAAEVAVDALAAAVGSDEVAAAYSTNLEGRAIAIAASSARSNAGANARESGFALQVFGRSIRESNCDCDRSMDASLLQTVYLQNDSSVLQAVEGAKGSWIEQITKRPSDRLSDGSKAEKLDVKKELARMQTRLKRVKEKKELSEDDEKQIARVESRIDELQQLVKEQAEAKVNPGKLTLESPELIRQAYLRTLSRLPTDDEAARCQEFLAAAENPVAGAKGLLWTLINTKEFIVNH